MQAGIFSTRHPKATAASLSDAHVSSAEQGWKLHSHKAPAVRPRADLLAAAASRPRRACRRPLRPLQLAFQLHGDLGGGGHSNQQSNTVGVPGLHEPGAGLS